ncbi:hypothetical protein EDD99_6413 [Streptomyces sp. 846.5]|nr:hypothetical protein [Streptomyces sp. 846.5]TDT98197.1 hypothetical protein EDD99_6413 [Streptomyces sp. 846.5]
MAAAFAVGASFSTIGLVLLGVILAARGTSVTSAELLPSMMSGSRSTLLCPRYPTVCTLRCGLRRSPSNTF